MIVILFLGNMSILILNILYTHLLLSRVKSIKYCVIAFLITNTIIYLASVLAYYSLGNTILYKFLFYFIVFLFIIYINLVFKESISKKLFTMFSIWMFSSIALYISAFIINTFLSHNSAYSSILIILIRCLIEIVFLPVGYYYLSKPYQNMLRVVSDKTINIMTFYTIIGFVVLISKYSFDSIYFTSINLLLNTVLFFVFMIMGYVIVIIAILSASKNISLQLEYQIVENQIEFQRENYKTLSEAIQNIYELRHDMTHHISLIKTMMEDKQYEKSLEYICKLNQNEINANIPRLCENFSADSIIKYYMSIALAKNIEFNANLEIPQDINVNDLDLCVVLGNCLENAIDACNRIENERRKYIVLKSKILGSHMVLKITNAFNGKVDLYNNSLKSLKKKQGHGIGLVNVKKTVHKYKGSYEFNYTNSEFEVDIVMNIKL